MLKSPPGSGEPQLRGPAALGLYGPNMATQELKGYRITAPTVIRNMQPMTRAVAGFHFRFMIDLRLRCCMTIRSKRNFRLPRRESKPAIASKRTTHSLAFQ